MKRSTVGPAICATFLVALSVQAAHATRSGLYTSQQAAAVAKAYAANCARCHGANLEGISAPPLKGPDLTAPGAQGKLTVGDLFKYMTSLMPAGNPGSLSHE
jgi:polar amino acid transport system substrate-binding protein